MRTTLKTAAWTSNSSSMESPTMRCGTTGANDLGASCALRPRSGQAYRHRGFRRSDMQRLFGGGGTDRHGRMPRLQTVA
ncbi:MAG: hypothetical protein LH632_20245, partial [Rhodoferax sp.]|nr:hypothetical protein [Rhodoferax sp.]